MSVCKSVFCVVCLCVCLCVCVCLCLCCVCECGWVGVRMYVLYVCMAGE